MPDLQVFPIALAGGLQDSKAIPDPGDMEKLENFSIYRGRLGLRAPLIEMATFVDDLGAAVTNILAMTEHDGKIFVVTYSAGQDEVDLQSMNKDGTSPTLEGNIWTGVVSVPTVSLASMEGGSATSGTKQLFITDFDQNEVTRVWNGATLSNLQEDFNNDTTSADVSFSLVFVYQFHLWGTGYFEEGASTFRPEMLRFSQPGLVPGTDPSGGDNPKEWWSNDHRSVGERGGKITALSTAAGRMLVFKEGETHAIFGFGADSWSRQEISRDVGAVGPAAAVSVDDRSCFFWSHNGPYISDGVTVQYIGRSIQQRIVDVLASTGTGAVVEYSPDDGIVYFIVGANANEYLAFDTRNNRWADGAWLANGGAALRVGASSQVFPNAGVGPAGAPSSLSTTIVDEDAANLSWTNGDTALGITTEIHRDTSTFSISGGTLVGTVGSGANSFGDTGLAEKTTYFWQVRHVRNEQNSAASNEVTDKTKLARPSLISLTTLVNGIKINVTNNSSGADLEIERSTNGTSFSLLTTVVLPGLGALVHNDTTATCGILYYYRVKAVQTAQTDSVYTAQPNRLACS